MQYLSVSIMEKRGQALVMETGLKPWAKFFCPLRGVGLVLFPILMGMEKRGQAQLGRCTCPP